MDIREQLKRDYLGMLSAEDRSVWEAKVAMERTSAAYKAAAKKFMAIRDLVTEQLGGSPYSEDLPSNEYPTEGRLRFVGMAPGEACSQLLMEVLAKDVDQKKPLSLARMLIALRKGGLDEVDSRTINAALMAMVKRGEVIKDGDKYKYNIEYLTSSSTTHKAGT